MEKLNEKEILQWGIYETIYFNDNYPKTKKPIGHCIVLSSKICNDSSSYINIVSYDMKTKKYGTAIYTVTKGNIGNYVRMYENEERKSLSEIVSNLLGI